MRTLFNQEVFDSIQSNKIIDNASPKAVLEWNFNNCFWSLGVNDINASSSVYNIGQTPKARNVGINDEQSFAGSWRETPELSQIIATDTANAPKMYSTYESNIQMPAAKDGFMYWTSHEKSVALSANSIGNAFRCDGLNLESTIAAPKVGPVTSNATPKAIGAVSDSLNNDVFLLMDSDPSTDFPAGGEIYLSKDIHLHSFSQPSQYKKLSGSYTVVAHAATEWLGEWAWDTTRAGSRTVRFGSYMNNVLRPGQNVKIVNTWWTSKITGVKHVWSDSDNSFWVEATLADPLPDDVVAHKDMIYVEFFVVQIDTPAVDISNTKDTVTWGLYALPQISGFYDPVQCYKHTTLSGTVSVYTLNHYLNERARAGGGIVSVNGTMALTDPIVIPAKMQVNFGTSTITIGAFTTRYNYAVYLNNEKTVGTAITGESVITGGTWNLTKTGRSLGFLSATYAHGVTISGVTVTNAKIHAIELRGCSNVNIVGCSISAVSGNAIQLSNHQIRDMYDSCYRILIKNNALTGNIESTILAGSEISQHVDSKIVGNTMTGSIICNDMTHCAIVSNNITGSVTIGAVNSSSFFNAVKSNSISGTLSLAGISNARGIAFTRIESNTFSSNPTKTYAAYTLFVGNTGGTLSAEYTSYSNNVIHGVAPMTVYPDKSYEVTTYRQWGQKIYLTTTSRDMSLTPGEYVVVSNVHHNIDGIHKVLSSSRELVLRSEVSGIISQKAVPPLNSPSSPNPEYKPLVTQPMYRPANKVVVKFANNYGSPKSLIVQLLTESGWENVYTMLTDETNSEPELDINQSNNIKTLTIYANSNGWSTTMTDASLDTATDAGAVRVVVDRTNNPNEYIQVVEVSARLELDVSDRLISASVSKELSSESEVAPVGKSSANDGSVDISNEDDVFSYHSMIGKAGMLINNVVVHMYSQYGTHVVKLGTMVVDQWQEDNKVASLSLLDKSAILQNMQSKNLFIFDTTNFIPNVSAVSAIKYLLAAVGFSQTATFGSFDTIKAVYAKNDATVWETIGSIAEAMQMALYFDEYGKLQLLGRDYIYPNAMSAFVQFSDFFPTITVIQPANDKFDINNVRPGMKVSGDSVPANTTVVSVTRATSGQFDSITLSSVVPGMAIEQVWFGDEDRNINYTFYGASDYGSDVDDYYKFRLIDSIANFSSYAYNVSQDVDYVGKAATRFVRAADFYVDSYSRSGTTVTAKLVKSSTGVKEAANGDTIFVSGVGADIDTSSASITNAGTCGDLWTNFEYCVTYQKSGSVTVPVNNDAAASAGFTTSSTGFLVDNLVVGHSYVYTGNVYLPSSQFTSLSIGTDATTTQTLSVTQTNTWNDFSIEFVASASQHKLSFSTVGGTMDSEFYVADNTLTALSRNTNLEDILELSLEGKTKPSGASIKYNIVDPYSDKTTDLENQTSIGQNQEMWSSEDLAIPVFRIDLDLCTADKFYFDVSAINEASTLNDVSGQMDNLKSWAIPFTGKFLCSKLSPVEIEYEGLEVQAHKNLPNQPVVVVKNSDDMNYVRSLNGGIPPKYTGYGFYKKQYTKPAVEETTTSLTPIKVVIKPIGGGSDSFYEIGYVEAFGCSIDALGAQSKVSWNA